MLHDVSHLTTAFIDLQAIRHNTACMARHSLTGGMDGALVAALPVAHSVEERRFPWPSMMGVVKGDAYGHGHIQVSQALVQEGVTMLASGCVREAAVLREGLRQCLRLYSPPHEEPVILSLIGPISTDEVVLCRQYDLIPAIHCHEQLALLEAAPGNIAIAIKCNSGMYRLGFDFDELPDVITRLSRLPGVKPVLAITHTHSADSGRYADVLSQAELFSTMLSLLRGTWPHMAASMSNSAGTLFAGGVAERIGPHISRPGVALYGVNPFAGTAMAAIAQDLRPAMSVSAPIVSVRRIPKGKAYGYDQTFTAQHDTYAAIVATGYADFYPRGMSGRGFMCVDNHRVPVIGRVSMQMTAVDITALAPISPHPKQAWLLGGQHPAALNATHVAAQWGTIPYEVFCLLGGNERTHA